MLLSTRIQKEQSELRQKLAALAGIEAPTAEQLAEMADADKRYLANEQRFRAALTSEDAERRDAGRDLETRDGKQWDALVDRFELAQVVRVLDEGGALTGPTQEVASELRSKRSYAGVPIPWRALSLEVRTGETIASGTPDPVRHHPIIGQLFKSGLSSRMGGSIIEIDHGTEAFPVATQGAVVGWGASETAGPTAAQAFQTTDKTLKPDYCMSCSMVLTRKSLKQSGAGLELAVRMDANSAMSVGLDDAVFNGTGSSGQPLGVVYGAPGNGVARTDAGAASEWADFAAEIVEFLEGNAATSPNDIRLAITPATWAVLDGTLYDSGSGLSQLDKLIRMMGAPVTTNVLPAGVALMTTSIGGVAPYVIGAFGGVDVVRDIYTQPGGAGSLKLTFLANIDIAVLRAAQSRVLEDLGS